MHENPDRGTSTHHINPVLFHKPQSLNTLHPWNIYSKSVAYFQFKKLLHIHQIKRTHVAQKTSDSSKNRSFLSRPPISEVYTPVGAYIQFGGDTDVKEARRGTGMGRGMGNGIVGSPSEVLWWYWIMTMSVGLSGTQMDWFDDRTLQQTEVTSQSKSLLHTAEVDANWNALAHRFILVTFCRAFM